MWGLGLQGFAYVMVALSVELLATNPTKVSQSKTWNRILLIKMVGTCGYDIPFLLLCCLLLEIDAPLSPMLGMLGYLARTHTHFHRIINQFIIEFQHLWLVCLLIYVVDWRFR